MNTHSDLPAQTEQRRHRGIAQDWGEVCTDKDCWCRGSEHHNPRRHADHTGEQAMQTDTTEPMDISLSPSRGLPRRLNVWRDGSGYVHATLWPPKRATTLAHGYGEQRQCAIKQGVDMAMLFVGNSHFPITKSESEQLIALFGFPVRS